MFHPLINLLLTFTLIVLLMRKKVPLGLVMVSAAILLGILFKVALMEQINTIRRAIISPVFLQLGIALNIIMFLEHVLRTKGYLSKTLSSLQTLIPSPKINMMILPAFLGLLPSPGGAMFSAPLVAEVGKDLKLTPEVKSQVNYWFRHIWEYFIPLYPGIILAAKIFEIPVGRISIILGGYFFIAVGVGYLFIIKKIDDSKIPAPPSRTSAEKRKALLDLVAGIWPIMVVVLVVLIFRADVGLTVVSLLVILVWINHYRKAELKTLFKESFSLNLILLIIGVLFFKEMLQTAGVVTWLPSYLKGFGIPDMLIVVVLTFFVAFATGLSQAYIATAFPLLIGITGTGAALRPGMLILAFISGFVGLMLSPLHLCFVLTVEYFKADFLKVLRCLIVPELIILASAVLFALIWK